MKNEFIFNTQPDQVLWSLELASDFFMNSSLIIVAEKGCGHRAYRGDAQIKRNLASRKCKMVMKNNL